MTTRKVIVYHDFGLTLCSVTDCATDAEAITEAEVLVRRMQFRSTRGTDAPWKHTQQAKGEIVKA